MTKVISTVLILVQCLGMFGAMNTKFLPHGLLANKSLRSRGPACLNKHDISAAQIEN